MRTPAAAVAWEFTQRHRWGLCAVAVYTLVIGVIKAVTLTRGLPIHFDTDESFAFMVMVPLASSSMYFLAIFTFGLDGDIVARESMFPRRRFTQPVTTTALIGWPMLHGSAAMVVLWLAVRALGLWPTEFVMPVVWPAFLAASLVAWTQALTWMGYPLPGMRIVVSVFVLWMLDAVVFLWIYRRPSEFGMLAILAPQVPIAYFVAHRAVARARRGDVPDWSGTFGWMKRVGPNTSRAFRTPASAQIWLEWNRIGQSLPGWMLILLPFELALLLLASKVPMLVVEILLCVLFTPVLMATFAAANVRKSSPQSRDAWGVSSFDGARPLTTADLIAAKLKVTICSTALAWLVVLVAIPIGLMLTGTMQVVVQKWIELRDAIGLSRAIVLPVLVLVGLVLTTWKQLVQSLYVGLTGREWLIKGSVFAVLTFLFLLGPAIQWIVDHKRVQGILWEALPLILGLLATAKVCAAGWTATRLHRTRLLSDRALVTGAALWCATVLALVGTMIWFFDTPFVAHYVLLLIAILIIPLARLSAAPLALAWNRHR